MATILEEIDALWEERAKRRKSFLEIFLDNLPRACEPAGEWFKREIEFAERELGLLQNFELLEDTEKRKEKLENSREKFEKAFENLKRLLEKVKKGEVAPLKILVKEKGKGIKGVPKPTMKPITITEFEEERISDALGMIMDMFSATTELEALLREMDTELRRMKQLSLLLPKLLKR